jgi:hypothetical protein
MLSSNCTSGCRLKLFLLTTAKSSFLKVLWEFLLLDFWIEMQFVMLYISIGGEQLKREINNLIGDEIKLGS